ncbi:hypothetical protein LV779_39740 [Streptomyces thinghirensis]|nr:hypothetical protein [Streptomyces thinghirensis]
MVSRSLAAVTVVSLIGRRRRRGERRRGGHCARQERITSAGCGPAAQRLPGRSDHHRTGGHPYTDMADQAGLTAGGTRTPSGCPASGRRVLSGLLPLQQHARLAARPRSS